MTKESDEKTIRATSPLLVVLAEDEAISAMAMRIELEKMGYKVVRVAARGADAIRHIRDVSPDLIILDIRLADGVSGLDVAREARRFSSAPIVFVTGYDLSLIPQVRDVSVSVVLQKPVNALSVHEAAEGLLA
jgi:CheY-like chemotaxis protein